jgi:hypothetical protein
VETLFRKRPGVPKPPSPLYLPKNAWCVSQCTYGCILRNERDGEMESVHAKWLLILILVALIFYSLAFPDQSSAVLNWLWGLFFR